MRLASYAATRQGRVEFSKLTQEWGRVGNRVRLIDLRRPDRVVLSVSEEMRLVDMRIHASLS